MIAQVNSSQVTNSNVMLRKKNNGIAPRPRSMLELKPHLEMAITELPKTKSHKKSKLKRMASLFNTKISRLLRREAKPKSYNALVNELSPEPKVAAKPLFSKLLTLPRARKAEKSEAKTKILNHLNQIKKNCPYASSISLRNRMLEVKALRGAVNIPNSLNETWKNQHFSKNLQHFSFKAEAKYEDFNIKTNLRRTRSLDLAQVKASQLNYSWLEAKLANPVEPNKSITDKLLEEILGKLEAMDMSKVKNPIENLKTNFNSQKLSGHQNFPKPMLTSESSTTSSAKHSEIEENESDLPPSSMEPVVISISASPTKQSSTEDSPTEMSTALQKQHGNSNSPSYNKKISPGKPIKSLRKKKMRRTLSGRKERSMEEAKTTTTTTTDSESDCWNLRNPNNSRTQPQTCFKKSKNSSFALNSLQSTKPSVDAVRQKRRDSLMLNDISGVEKTSSRCLGRDNNDSPSHSPTDSYDQGFETGSMDSPIRRMDDKSPRISIDMNLKQPQANSAFFSTPIKKQGQKSLNSAFNESGSQCPSQYGQQMQCFSPISMVMKSRRRSIYDSDSRRSSSIAMQVIREDRSWEHEQQVGHTNHSQDFSAVAAPSALNLSQSIQGEASTKSSSFWIQSGDFFVALDIFENDAERVRLLYEIFCQKSCDTKTAFFGIDGHKFALQKGKVELQNVPQRPNHNSKTSHYWFSTGDMTIPFSGKLLPNEKVQRLFQFIKMAVEDTGVLRFGVDDVEFSKVCEMWNPSPKYSLDSNNSLASKSSRKSMEGNRKYSLPYASKSRRSSSLSRDISDFESDDFRELESLRSSQSPFGSDAFELRSLDSHDIMPAPRNSEVSMRESFGQGYENEPLDQLFNEKPLANRHNPRAKLSIADLMNILQAQHRRLSTVKGRLSFYHNSPITSYDALEALRDSPEYLPLLKNIVSDITRIGSSNGFKNCSLEELERYMFFLSRYADICLSSCNNHMDKIINTLNEQRTIYPPENELQKSHDHNPAALSEHQLRIQASLQRLNIPDWFRQYNQKSPDGAGTGGYKPGNFTRKRTQDSGRWAGLNSKTTSLSSLGSQRSDRSPLLLSPSAHSHHGGQSASGHGPQTHHHGGVGVGHSAAGTGASGGAFSRWSTSHLNSSQTSPSVSQRGSFSRGGPINSSFISVNSGHSSVIRNSMRQPYLGWRSQEKLSQRTAHERLASSLLSQQQRTSPTTNTPGQTAANRKLQPVTPEIQSSIKEVTSAIVHYVNDQTNQQRSRSTSPNSRKCWLESSFVGIRPLDSPQTPVIEGAPFIGATAANLRPGNINNNNSFHIANHNIDAGNATVVTASAFLNSSAPLTGNDLQQLTRMNNGGLNNGTTSTSSGGGGGGVGGVIHYPVAPERSLSNASLEDVLASLLGLNPHPQQPLSGGNQPGSSSLASDAFARSSTGGATVNDHKQYMTQKQQQQLPQQQPQQQQGSNLLGISKEEQQRLRRRSEGDAPTKQQKQHQQLQQQQQQYQQQQQQQQQLEQKFQHQTTHANKAYASDSITTLTNTHTQAGNSGATTANGHAGGGGGSGAFLPPRRVSLGDSSESNNRTTTASGELQVKCRNNKCDRTATPLDAKKYYKSCHNCTYLYCSRECRRAHWEKHRKACLHSRVSNLCRQVLASCKDDSDSLRHLSLLARKGFLSQGRGVVRILFRSPESAEGFIKNGFQCMGEASYVRWPDLMPAEMGLELYSELLKLSTEYRPDSKMLVYVAVCVVSEAPSVGQAPVRWERQLVSRCAKLKLCKTVLAELDQQPTAILQQPITMVAVPEPTTEVLILTFNPQLRNATAQREMVLSNILDILSRRGVILRKHYPEIFQRFQSYTEGQTDKINPVTLHPRDSQTGQNFVCIIMPVQSDTEIIKLPSMADGGNRVTSIDVGSPTAITQLEDNELLTRTSNSAVAS